MRLFARARPHPPSPSSGRVLAVAAASVAAVAVTALAVAAATPDRSVGHADHVDADHAHVGHVHGQSGTVEAHATWFRHLTAKALLDEATAVVRAEVVSVTELPDVTASDAGSAAGAPSIPHRQVTFRRLDAVWGQDPGAAFAIVHALPPHGTVLVEDPAYVPGETYLLFLRPSQWPGLLQRVGIDGRIAERGGKLVGMLPNGPASAINAHRDNLESYLAKEAAK